MRSLPYAAGAAALGLLSVSAAAPVAAAHPVSAAAAAPAREKADRDFTIEDARITESSGLAASRRHPGVYWTHNDQDEPRVFAVDSRTGRTVATVTLTGVGKPRDMEAISVGPDGRVYVGDIGDNLDGTWKHVWIYAFPEPARLADTTVRAVQYTVKYADGARNAEALMVHPKTGRAYIASKNEEGGGLYEGPAKLSAAGTNVFRRVGEVPWVTDGAFSPDGRELVLRGYLSARAYEWKDGRLGADRRVRAPIQGQSESVSYTPDGRAVMIGSEGRNSEVRRVEVERPDGAGSGGKSSGGSDGTSASPGTGDGETSATTYGLMVLGGALLLFMAGKRLFRRS
jgi:hypothetical protein